MPTDDVQKLTLGLRLVEEQIISRQTFRSNWLNMPMPADEDIRVNLEQALMSEPMAPKTYLRVLQARFPKTWADIVSGTELEQFAHAEQEAQQPSPEEGSGMPPVPPELMQQMMMQQQMPPQMPQQMPPQMPVQAPGPVQNVPPQMVGQLTPEMLGLPPGTPPEIFYELTGQELPTLNDMLTGGRLPPEMAGLMGGM
jgi:hypothetical protein